MRTLRLRIVGTVLLALLWGAGVGAVEPDRDAGPTAGIVAAQSNPAELAWVTVRDGVFVDAREWERHLSFGVDAITRKKARRLRRMVRDHLALLERLPDYSCYAAARKVATEAAELLDEGLTDILESRERRAQGAIHVASLRLDEYWGRRDAVDCTWAEAFRPTDALIAPAATQAEAAADVLARFPTTIAEESVEVEAFTGPEWIEWLIAGDSDAATASERVEGLVETFGASPEDLTVATALIEPDPFDSAAITALQLAGVGTERWSKSAVAGFLGLDYWWDLHIGDTPVTRFRDSSLPGSHPLTVFPGTKGTIWIIDAQRPLLVDAMRALEGETPSITAGTTVPGSAAAGERVEVPEVDIAVTFPEGWEVWIGPEPASESGLRGLGPSTRGWSVASGRAPGPGDDGGMGGCGLALYRPTDTPLDEAMEHLIDDGDQVFPKLGPIDGGMYGYVGPYEFYSAGYEMAIYALASGDAIATLTCLDDQAPEDHWRSIVQSIEIGSATDTSPTASAGTDAARPSVGSDAALAAAEDNANRADNLRLTEPGVALDHYRDAWVEIERARDAGRSSPAFEALEVRVRAGLDPLYGVRIPDIEKVASLPEGSDPIELVEGPSGGAVYIDREASTVARADLKSGKVAPIVGEGEKPRGNVTAMGRPVALASAGPDVVIVDDQARPWRWKPSDAAGAGKLKKLKLQGQSGFEPDHGDVEAIEPPVGRYRMYVAEPSLDQIMRYQQTFDGSAFQEPSPYLASQTAEVSDLEQLHIDSDMYALLDDTVRRYAYGKYDGTFALDTPPDDGDVRPGRDYRLVDGSGQASNDGRLYLYDALHHRVVGFSKVDGSYLGQWMPKGEGTQMDDVRGMYVISGGLNRKGKRRDDTLVWITPEGVFRAKLPTKGVVIRGDGAEVEFVIEPGQTVDEIEENLVERGLLVDVETFRHLVIEERVDQLIKPGTYTLDATMTPRQIVDLLAGEPGVSVTDESLS